MKHIIKINDIGNEPLALSVEVSKEDRAILADDLSLDQVRALIAQFSVVPSLDGKTFVVGLTLSAMVDFNHEQKEIALDVEEEDCFTTDSSLVGEDEADWNAPVLIENGEIDLGQMLYDYFALSVSEQGEERLLAEGEGVLDDLETQDTYKPFAHLKEMIKKK